MRLPSRGARNGAAHRATMRTHAGQRTAVRAHDAKRQEGKARYR
jgi:hypothetical protein